ncbi:TetR/AcrR family transcriptional regulator [Streptomyces camelliae]|uniref:WHG domain-containing protein n=1 Tax=Streptomyces camelliae TaxID=3004093 RepID=A0ABY7P2U6_9ACTN|nr:TetR/AcrR family transcriptional regulator [Streptomyces sp. HUAS 2-6]WBO63865.1 WHG domain-containing protein [Streptomyces sp. HUAS 2-6]
MPRPGLNLEIVVAEAARLADEVGLDHLTLTALAQRFGVATPSLYKHVGGLDDLQRHIATRAVRELGDAMAAASVGRARSDALRAMADAYRDYARAHPGRYAATLHAPGAADTEHITASDALLRTVFAVLHGYDLGDDDLVDATRAIRAMLHGFVALEAAGGFGMPQDIERSYARLIDTLDTVFTAWA